MQKKKQTKPIKQIIFYIVLILIVLLITFSEDIIKLANKNSINLAENDDTQTVINPSNSPYFVAGMIPIKWEIDHFVITTKDDPNWYDYEGGKPAYVMLNDGYYRSEIERGVESNQLMENNVGVGVPDDPSTRGTILMWIPRFAFNEDGDIQYIQGIGKANEAWTIPDMFTHKQEETMPDFLLTGIWFETDVDTNYANKVATMNTKDSIYGFIANTKALASDQTTGNEIENYINKLFTDTGTDDQWSPLQSEETTNTTNKIDNTNTNVGASIARPQIADITNPNRVILHIINQKNQDPIKAKVSYNKDTGLIDVQVTYTQYGIEKILYENTQQLTLEKNGRQATASTEGISVEAGNRTITIIDKAGNTKEILVEVIPAIYVTFYPSDGTLAFANKKNPLPNKGTYTAYEDISESEYNYSNTPPWYSNATNIKTVEFVDKISPTSTALWFYNCNAITKINNIEKNLDTSKVTSMKHMFSYCGKLTSLNLSNFNTSNVIDMSYMFRGCGKLTSLDVSNFSTSNVTNMCAMFDYCTELITLDLSSFSTSNVTDMNYMFHQCSSLTTLDLSSFNTSNVTNMSYMFKGCTGLTTLDLSSFNIVNVTDMYAIFSLCPNLIQISFGDNWNKEVTLPNPTQDGYTCSGWYSDAEFTNKVAEAGANYTPAGAITIYAQMVQNIYATLYTDGTLGFASNTSIISGKTKQYGPWNISNQTGNMPWYSYRTSIKTVEFVDKIKPISTANWFSSCNNLTQINHMKENLDTSKVTNMGHMFGQCSGLTSLDVTNFNTSNVTDMAYMFYDCSGLTSLDVSSFDTSNVTIMNSMFFNCNSLIELDLTSLNTENVTNMSSMFGDCSSLSKLDLTSLNTENVTNMNAMFARCENLTELDLSKFNTSNVTDMSLMFYVCNSLIELDLTSLNTENVTNMSSMFGDCSSLSKLDLTSLNTENVTNMNGMFQGCENLTELNLNKFNTSNVTNMRSMFNRCGGLTEIDLSKFNTSNVTDMNYMFYYCQNLKTIYVGPNWKLASNRTNMFNNCGTSTTTLKK